MISGAQSVKGTNPRRTGRGNPVGIWVRFVLFTSRRLAPPPRCLAARVPNVISGAMTALLNSHLDDELDSYMNAPLDSRQVRAFAVLARTGSFTQTARELHLTQSAISHSMKALEGDVGCRLLDRLGKKIVLTQAGEQLLHHATRILHE